MVWAMASNLNFPEDCVKPRLVCTCTYTMLSTHQNCRNVTRSVSLFCLKKFPLLFKPPLHSHTGLHWTGDANVSPNSAPLSLFLFPQAHNKFPIFGHFSQILFKFLCEAQTFIPMVRQSTHPSQAKCYKVQLSDSSITYFISIDIFWSSQALYRKKWLPEIYA